MSVTIADIPDRLHAAYDWVDAAGELSELAELTGMALAKYCREAEANAAEHGHAIRGGNFADLARRLARMAIL